VEKSLGPNARTRDEHAELASDEPEREQGVAASELQHSACELPVVGLGASAGVERYRADDDLESVVHE